MYQEPSKSTDAVYPCSLHEHTRLFGLTLVPGDVWLVPELGRILDKLDIEPAFRASVCSEKKKVMTVTFEPLQSVTDIVCSLYVT